MRQTLPILILGLLAATGCDTIPQGVPSMEPSVEATAVDTWVATDPIQCLGNPWEQDWLAAHNGDYGSYPGDPSTPGLEPEEVVIITGYYERQGVKVIACETGQQNDAVCQSCACPLGYTLYLLVPGDDVQTMLDLEFRLENP